MKVRFLRPMLVTAVVATTAASCARVARPEDRPAWTLRSPAHSPTTLYFAGFTSGARTEEDALEMALHDALGRVSLFLGTTVESRFKSREAERNRKYEYDIEASVQIRSRKVPLRQVRVDQSHHEVHGAKHHAWVLVTYPRAEYERTLAELRRDDADRASSGLYLLREGMAKLQEGRADEAADAFQRGLDSMAGIEGMTPVDDPTWRAAWALEQELRAQLKAADRILSESWRTVAVGVLLAYDGKATDSEPVAAEVHARTQNQVAASGLAAAETEQVEEARTRAALAGDGAAVASVGAETRSDWLLLVELDGRFTSEIYGQFFATATGRVVLVNVRTRQNQMVVPLTTTKGGHITRQAALNTAVAGLRDAVASAVDQCLAQVPRQKASR